MDFGYDNKRCALHEAAFNGNEEVVREIFLLRNFTSYDLIAPQRCAGNQGHNKIAEILLEKINIEKLDKYQLWSMRFTANTIRLNGNHIIHQSVMQKLGLNPRKPHLIHNIAILHIDYILNCTELYISVLYCNYTANKRYCMSTKATPTKTQRITLDVPAAQHKKIKTLASMMDLSIKDLMLMSFEEFMHKKYNKVTEKAIKQTLTGKNVKRFKTLDDLIEDLED